MKEYISLFERGLKFCLGFVVLFTLLFFAGCKKEENNPSNRWLQKSSISSIIRRGATSFVIGDKGYIGTGYDGNELLNDFWEYNSVTDVWTQKANFSGLPRYYAVGFAIGSKGYIGTGGAGSGGDVKDFWEYNPSTNAWTQKADVPGVSGRGRFYAAGFSINSLGYIVAGTDRVDDLSTLNEYNPSTNTWSQKADYPGNGKRLPVAIVVGSKGYVGTGNDNTQTYKDDFWEYNQATNTWGKKANFGGGVRGGAVGFAIGANMYIGTGSVGPALSDLKNDFWRYNSVTDTWKRLADFGGTARNTAIGFAIDSKGYIGTGGAYISSTSGVYTKDIWEFTP
jgi:N-acetylneuraminic acid mutarotase